MKNLIKITIALMTLTIIGGCSLTTSTEKDRYATREIGDKLSESQPTPTDIGHSLERHNLIKRAYWVNGQRDKARMIPNPIADMPFGYVILFTSNGSVVGRFTVDGKVTSLNSFLTGNYYYSTGGYQYELSDVDGSYGENDGGIFFFTTDGKYVEWTGTYLYSDIPFEVSDPIIKVGK